MRIAGLLLLLLLACESSGKQKPPKREIEGTLSLDGKPLEMLKCRAGRGVTTYVELVTPTGTLRFEDKQLFWRVDDTSGTRGDPLQCDKLDRSWGGGLRKDGSSYFRGTLIFVCKGPAGALTGDVVVDCGGITAEERKQLDDNRAKMLDEQKQGSSDAL